MTQTADGLAKLDSNAIPEGGSVDPSQFLPGDVTVAWVFRVSQKLMADDIYLTMERLDNTHNTGILLRNTADGASASKWLLGLRGVGDNHFRLYSYALNEDILDISDATGEAKLRGYPLVAVRHGMATAIPADLAENQLYFGY